MRKEWEKNSGGRERERESLRGWMIIERERDGRREINLGWNMFMKTI